MVHSLPVFLLYTTKIAVYLQGVCILLTVELLELNFTELNSKLKTNRQQFNAAGDFACRSTY